MLAALRERTRDVVLVVLHQRALDALVDVPRAEGDRLAAGLRKLGRALVELLRDHPRDVLHEVAIFIAEDVALLLAGDEEIRQRAADGVGDLGRVEVTLAAADVHLQARGGRGFRNEGRVRGEGAPLVAWELVFGGFGDLAENRIFLEQAGNHDGRSCWI